MTDDTRPGLQPEDPGAEPAIDAATRTAARSPVLTTVDPSARVLDVPNEAIPEVPPEEGDIREGNIPAARRRRAWSRVQALNWRLFLVRFLSAGLSVFITLIVTPGLSFGEFRASLFIPLGLIFGVLNATVKPLLQFLVLRFIFSTYGIVVVAINTVLLVLTASLLPDDTLEASGLLALVLGGAVVGLLGLVFETLLGANPPVLDRDYKERNGLR
jgi:putative membrane protein